MLLTSQSNLSSTTRRIYLLGTFSIYDQMSVVELPGLRAKNLLAYLALNPNHLQQRSRLAERLWPDLSPQRARHSLSDLLYRLPTAVRHHWLAVEQNTVGLAQPDTLWIDAHIFEQLALSDDDTAWSQAITLYRGDLLPELHEDWMLERRVALRETYLTCLERLGQTQEARRQYPAAYDTYTTLIQADPLREAPYRGLMRTLASLGRPAEAAAIFTQLEQTLAQTLDVLPSSQTRQLALKLSPGETAVSPLPLPFIGRQHERTRLLKCLDDAGQGRGGCAIILGEAGIGKSRLLAELAQAADWRGWHIAWGKADEFTTPQPYAPLAQALSAALPTPRVQQIARLIRPFWLAIAANLIPPLRQLPNLPDISTLQQPDSHLAPAVLRLLNALGQIAPHLLLLDDMQWAPTAVWNLLDSLRDQLTDLPILIALSSRSDAIRQQPNMMATLQRWDRAGSPIIHLKTFSTTELQSLIRSVRGHDAHTQTIADLHRASGGNPLLALTLLSDKAAVLPNQPSTFSDVIRPRLSSLSAPAHLGLQAASVLGYHFHYAAWEAMLTQFPADQLPALAGELEQAGLIQLQTNTYCFTHDSIRAMLYAEMPTDRRQRWHKQALQTLGHITPDDSSTLLYHAEQANQPDEIARYALRVGEEALARLQFETAVTTLGRGLDLLPEDAWTERFTAVAGLIRALEVLADRRRQAAEITRLESIALKLGDPARQAEAAYHRAHFAWQTGQLDAALTASQHGLELAQTADHATRSAHLWYMNGRILREQGKYPQARAAFTNARDLYQQTGSDVGVALTTDTLGGLAWAEGNHQEAIHQHATAAQQFHTLENPFHEAKALTNLGSAYWSAGQYADARITLQKTLAICRELSDRRGEADALDNLGGIAWILADYGQAIQLYGDALAIRRDINDPWGISISLGNLGSAYRLMDDWQTAVRYYDEALQVNRTMGRRRGEGYNLHGRGLAWLDAGRPQQAQQDLTAALALRVELGEQDNQLETLAALALVHAAAKDVAAATTVLPDLLARLRDDHRAALRQWTHFAAYRLYALLGAEDEARQHLRQARAAMQTVAANLPEADRSRFLRSHPLNREIETAAAQYIQQRPFRLVRADVPLGRKLTDADYVTITWTLAALDDDEADTVQARRHILKRLLAEAEAQQASPTDSDLAAALNVSRRTILRDMKALNEAGLTLSTRRR